jgi:SAM-dependent methyltransferase
VISSRLLALVRCPDCHGTLTGAPEELRCERCGRRHRSDDKDYLVLRPRQVFAEETRFLEESFHSDGRDETVSPPLLSAGVRFAMLKRFLSIGPADTVLDLGCGSGRFSVWTLDSGAYVLGVDVGTFFAAEARDRIDLVVGDLRQLPLEDASVSKAYAIDVFEHLSRDSLALTLREVARVLAPGGALFVYTHVRQGSPLAPILGLESRLARAIERWGLADLTLERLRPTDHLNPLADYADLRETAAAAGFELSALRYYTPLLTRLIEGILVPVAAHALARVAARRAAGSGRGGGTGVGRAARRTARVAAKQRIARRGPTYWILRALTAVVMLDVLLLGRVRSGPFFARLVKADGRPRRSR